MVTKKSIIAPVPRKAHLFLTSTKSEKAGAIFLILSALVLVFLIGGHLVELAEHRPKALEMTSEILNSPTRRGGVDYIVTRGDGWAHVVRRWELLGETYYEEVGYSVARVGWWREIMRRK